MPELSGWLCLVAALLVVAVLVVAAKVPPQQEVVHDCDVPSPELPPGVVRVKVRWRCPVCKQRWKIEQGRRSDAERVGRASVKWSNRQIKAAMDVPPRDPPSEGPPPSTQRAVEFTIPDEWTKEG